MNISAREHEQVIADTCLYHLQQLLPDEPLQFRPRFDEGIDGELVLEQKALCWHVEIKGRIAERVTVSKLKEIQQQFGKLLVMARYIGPKQLQELQQCGIDYMDGEGNMHLQQGQFYLHVEGRKSDTGLKVEEISGRAFEDAGLKVGFVLLQAPVLAALPLRTVAETAGVSLGSANYAVRDLIVQGYIVEHRRRRRLIKPEALLERWLPLYAERLFSANLVGHYRFWNMSQASVWQEFDLPENLEWGAEPAANKLLNGYLRPGHLTLYIIGSSSPLVSQWKLIPEQKAPQLTIRRKFWNDGVLRKYAAVSWPPGVTPPLLAYADLLATGDGRNAEVAQMLRNRYMELEWKNDGTN